MIQEQLVLKVQQELLDLKVLTLQSPDHKEQLDLKVQQERPVLKVHKVQLVLTDLTVRQQ